MIKKPWVEQYRPATLGSVIFTDERISKTFQKFVSEKFIPNLLLYGGPGTGKTSVSSALLKDLGVDRLDRLRINCSDEKIDALRDKVKSFAMTMPVGYLKVVQLEEFDYLGHDAQALLRSLIEEVGGSCRFIATCNYINKITPPLRSRFQEFAFVAPNRDLILERAATILAEHNIEADIDDVDSIISAGYPDFRKIIQLLEQHSSSGKLVISSAEAVFDWKLQLLPALESGDMKVARKIVCDSATKEEVAEVFKFLFDNLPKLKKFKGREDDAIVLLAQYQYQHAFAADAEINTAALFIELGRLIK